MGSWGTGTFDNDTASDFMMGISDKLSKVCRSMLKKKPGRAKSSSARGGSLGRQYYYYDEARASAVTLATLFKSGAPVAVEDLTDAESVIRVMLEDKEWIGRWRSPDAITRSLKSDLAHVQWALARAKATLSK